MVYFVQKKKIDNISNAHDGRSVTPCAAEAEAWLHVGFNFNLDGLRLTWVIDVIQNIYIVEYTMIDIHGSLWSSNWLVEWFEIDHLIGPPSSPPA